MKRMGLLVVLVVMVLLSGCRKAYTDLSDATESDTEYVKAPENVTAEGLLAGVSAIPGDMLRYEVQVDIDMVCDLSGVGGSSEEQIQLSGTTLMERTANVAHSSGVMKYKLFGNESEVNSGEYWELQEDGTVLLYRYNQDVLCWYVSGLHQPIPELSVVSGITEGELLGVKDGFYCVKASVPYENVQGLVGSELDEAELGSSLSVILKFSESTMALQEIEYDMAGAVADRSDVTVNQATLRVYGIATEGFEVSVPQDVKNMAVSTDWDIQVDDNTNAGYDTDRVLENTDDVSEDVRQQVGVYLDYFSLEDLQKELKLWAVLSDNEKVALFTIAESEDVPEFTLEDFYGVVYGDKLRNFLVILGYSEDEIQAKVEEVGVPSQGDVDITESSSESESTEEVIG